ncbi:MAG: SPOR domain-containing protein [Gammaproteobacteria bacterium]|jgi:hypothetical protein
MRHQQNESEAVGMPGGYRAYGDFPSVEIKTKRKSRALGSGFKRFLNMLDNNFWLLSGMTLVITALIIGWWILSGQGPGGTHLFNNDQETKAPQTSQQTDTVDNQAIEQLEDHLTGLTDRVEMLTDSITYLESKLIRAHVLTDSIITAEQQAHSLVSKQPATSESVRDVDELPPSAAGQTARQIPAELTAAPRETTVRNATVATTEKSTTRLASKQPDNAKTTQDTARGVAVKESRAPVFRHQTPVNTSKGGPWVINLTSSPNQADADRFAAKVRSRGIETQQQQVTVKGNHYWRVQTMGFPTADEAQGYAGKVKEKLGLQDVWITRR